MVTDEPLVHSDQRANGEWLASTHAFHDFWGSAGVPADSYLLVSMITYGGESARGAGGDESWWHAGGAVTRAILGDRL